MSRFVRLTWFVAVGLLVGGCVTSDPTTARPTPAPVSPEPATTALTATPVSAQQPPFNELELRVINALGTLSVTGKRAQLPFRDASIWAEVGTGLLFVNAYPLGTVDPNFAIADQRQLAGTQVQHVRRPSYPQGTTSIRFECSADEYWVSGDAPPGFADMDAFVERFVSALACSK